MLILHFFLTIILLYYRDIDALTTSASRNGLHDSNGHCSNIRSPVPHRYSGSLHNSLQETLQLEVSYCEVTVKLRCEVTVKLLNLKLLRAGLLEAAV